MMACGGGDWVVWLVLVSICWSCYCLRCCDGFGTFGFDVHHRFSDPVKGVLGVDDLPKMGTFDYYSAMVHRDRTAVRGRGLAAAMDGDDAVSFVAGNETFRISSLGFLHYANVSLGTPSVWFLVALDTGSDLFWVPCNCTSCVKALKSRNGDELDFNIYSPNASSTSKRVPCESSLCEFQRGCSKATDVCSYEVLYLSNDTSSSGVLVEDVLRLVREDDNLEAVDAPITFGCGQVQTGSFLDGAAPNGLFGLGVQKTSVPSILSRANITADSFSLCFGSMGIGRLNFGDKGSADQDETPLNINQLHPTYNISVTKIIVGKAVTDVEFSAIFDSGTSFTYLNDPAYGQLSDSFNSQVKDKQHAVDPSIPFEFCYDLSSNPIPNVTLTMKGDSQFLVIDPLVLFPDEKTYCLGIVKSPNVNIIGQNFMTGYRVVFDREKMILGWKESNCYDFSDSNTLPLKPRTAVPPAIAVSPGDYNPEATSVPRRQQSSAGDLSQLSGTNLLMLCLFILAII
ncbi:hypothetical protein Sjap_009883 [Stephania japonica]|uniref:Peptidase A1 domain-containing protein n=1 Tax=Stephania japonica TaxID=461633 RepID=A0AAP0J8H5_9MAGN